MIMERCNVVLQIASDMPQARKDFLLLLDSETRSVVAQEIFYLSSAVA